MHPILIEQRTALHLIDQFTKDSFTLIYDRLMACKDDDPDGDWDDLWASDDIEEFRSHFDRHADDFGATDWNDYAKQSQNFYQRALKERLPMTEYPNAGRVVAYDPKSNSFGVYTPSGKTVSFYKPEEGAIYFSRLTDRQIIRGGRVIHPLSGPLFSE